MKAKTVNGVIQKWENSLAVRIPEALAHSAHFHQGTCVKISTQDTGIIIKSTTQPMLSLEERLQAFDPQKHGGEVMISSCIGVENF